MMNEENVPAARATLAIMTNGCPNARTEAYFSAEGTTERLASPAIIPNKGVPAASTIVPSPIPLINAKKSASLIIRSDSSRSSQLEFALALVTRLVAAVAMKKNK